MINTRQAPDLQGYLLEVADTLRSGYVLRNTDLLELMSKYGYKTDKIGPYGIISLRQIGASALLSSEGVDKLEESYRGIHLVRDDSIPVHETDLSQVRATIDAEIADRYNRAS